MKAVISGALRGLEGEVRVPGDKSISHRAAIVGALASGTSRVRGFSPGADCESTLRCVEALGARVSLDAGELRVEGRGSAGLTQPAGALDAGNSGTTMRLLAGATAAHPLDVSITGDQSLLSRPMQRIVEPLAWMGARIETTDEEGHPPLRIRGGDLSAIDYAPQVASAQVKSAVILAGLGAAGVTTVREKARTRDHTERMLRRSGIHVASDGLAVSVEPGTPSATEVDIPGDFSSAAFLITAALICPGSALTIRGVGLNPTRIGFLDLLRGMGAPVSVALEGPDAWEPRGDLLVRDGSLEALEMGPEEVALAIDEIPLVALLATRAEGITVIRGAGELRHKESDRIRGTVQGLASLGARVRETDDGMEIEGPCDLTGSRTGSGKDHRIAMMLAVAALGAEGTTTIDDWEWTDISYPDFLGALAGIGAEVERG